MDARDFLAPDEFVFNGIDGATGGYLTPPVKARQITALAKDSPQDREHLHDLERRLRSGTPSRGVREGVDPLNLAQAGWGVIFAHQDQDRVPAIREALGALQEHDLVLGPAQDGGYYLLALARPAPLLFDGIPWRPPGVLQATLARADFLGLRTRLLKPMRDVDTLGDLRAEWSRISPLVDPVTRAAIEAVLAGG